MWQGIGSVLQGAGSLYGAYAQNKNSKKLFNLQKSYLDDEKKRKKRDQTRLEESANTYLGHKDNNARLPIY